MHSTRSGIGRGQLAEGPLRKRSRGYDTIRYDLGPLGQTGTDGTPRSRAGPRMTSGAHDSAPTTARVRVARADDLYPTRKIVGIFTYFRKNTKVLYRDLSICIENANYFPGGV